MTYLIIPLLLTSFFFLSKPKPRIEKISPTVIDLNNQISAFPRTQIKDYGQKAPMIVVIPGRNATELQLQSTIPLDLKARVFFLRSEKPKRLFFEPRLKYDEEIVAPALKEAGKEVEEGIAKLLKLYPTNKLIVYGFSAGGALALTYGLTGKANTIMAFSGSLPSTLYPSEKNKTKVLTWHGNLDTVVPYELGLNTAKAFEDAGFFTRFKEKKNSHILPPKEVVKEYFETALGDKD